MWITETQISLVKPKDGLIAFASVVINNCIYLGSIGVHEKLDGTGYRLTYPTKNYGHNSQHIYHPINRTISKAIEDAVFEKLKDVMNKGSSNVRYSGNHA